MSRVILSAGVTMVKLGMAVAVGLLLAGFNEGGSLGVDREFGYMNRPSRGGLARNCHHHVISSRIVEVEIKFSLNVSTKTVLSNVNI